MRENSLVHTQLHLPPSLCAYAGEQLLWGLIARRRKSQTGESLGPPRPGRLRAKGETGILEMACQHGASVSTRLQVQSSGVV